MHLKVELDQAHDFPKLLNRNAEPSISLREQLSPCTASRLLHKTYHVIIQQDRHRQIEQQKE